MAQPPEVQVGVDGYLYLFGPSSEDRTHVTTCMKLTVEEASVLAVDVLESIDLMNEALDTVANPPDEP